MKHTQSRSILFLAVPFASVVLSYQSLALEYSVDLTMDSRYENNATLTTEAQSDLENSAGLSLAARQDTKSLQFNGNYSLRYIDYKDETNDSRGQFTGNSNLLAELSPQRLFWTVDHSLSEQTRNRSDRETADNQELRQEVSTGPRLQFNLTGRDTLTAEAKYSEIFYSTPSENNSESTADTTSQLGTVNWSHAFSRITSFTTGYSYRETTRDRTNTSPERTNTLQNAYVGFNRQLRELRYSLQVGGSQSEADDGSDSSGLFYSAELIRTAGDTTIGLTASQQQTDTSIGLDQNSDLYDAFDDIAALFDSGLSLGNANVEGVAEISAYQLNVRSTRYCSRCSYNFRYNFIESDYESESEADDKQHSVNIGYTLRLNRRLSTTLGGQWEKTETEENNLSLNEDDIEETSADLRFNWSASQRLSVTLSGGYEERSESEGEDVYNSFARLGLRYRLFESEL